MNSLVDISNIKLKLIIQELWNHAEYSSIYSTFKIEKPKFDWNKGIKDAKPGGYIEIFCGKILKIEVLGNKINASGFDNLYGSKKAFDIISKINK